MHGDGIKIVGFYVGADQSLFMNQPNFSKREIAQFVPKELHGDRYEMYVEGMNEWLAISIEVLIARSSVTN